MQTQPTQSGTAIAIFATRGAPPGEASKADSQFGVNAKVSPPGTEAKDPIQQLEKKLLGKEPNARPEKPDSLPKSETVDPVDLKVAELGIDVKVNLAAQERVALEASVIAKATIAPIPPAPKPTALPADILEAVAPIRTPVPMPPVELPAALPTKQPATDEYVAIKSDLSSDEVEALGIQSVKVDLSHAPPTKGEATDEASPSQDVHVLGSATARDEVAPGATDEAVRVKGPASEEWGAATDEYTPPSDIAGVSQSSRKGEARDEAAASSDEYTPAPIGKSGKVQPMPAETFGDSSEEAAEGFKDNSSDESAPTKPASGPMVDGIQTKGNRALRSSDEVKGVDVAARVDRLAVVRQVADRIELLAAAPRDGVTVRLEPRDLGSITMVVKSHGEEVDAHIVATNEAVRTALDGSRIQLREALESRGLSLGTMTLGHEAAQNSSERDAAMNNAPSHRGFAMANHGMDHGGAPTMDWRAAARSSHGMDLWI